MWRQVFVRLRSLWRWRRQESELDAEIRFHLSEEIDERIAAGMSPEQARAADFSTCAGKTASSRVDPRIRSCRMR